jgi:hypothetical protein
LPHWERRSNGRQAFPAAEANRLLNTAAPGFAAGFAFRVYAPGNDRQSFCLFPTMRRRAFAGTRFSAGENNSACSFRLFTVKTVVQGL